MRNKILIYIILILTLTGCQQKTLKNEKEYYCCEKEYIKESDKCLKKKYYIIEVLYTCPDGFIAGNDGICYRPDGKRGTFATKDYSCPSGGTLNGNKCESTISEKEPYKCTKEEYNKINNKEEEKIEIKDYIGKNYKEAKKELEEQGLKVIVLKKESQSNIEEIVIEQTPLPNTKVNYGETVTLYIPYIP